MKDFPFLITKMTKSSSKDEDELLLFLTNNIGNKWKFISKYFPNKNTLECFKRFSIIDPRFKKGKFSEEEDNVILKTFSKSGCNWALIAKNMTQQSSKQIRSRFINLLKKHKKIEKIGQTTAFSETSSNVTEIVQMMIYSRECLHKEKDSFYKNQ